MLGKLTSAFRPEAVAPLSRRGFLKVSALSAGGFAVACSQEPAPAPPADPAPEPEAQAPQAQDFAANAYVKIHADDRVTVVSRHLEMGQGVTTGLLAIAAEELDAAWDQVDYEFAPADVTRYANPLFGIQGTGGSTAMASSWDQLRQAGAGARALLISAAAQLWDVPAEEITVSAGRVRHEASGQESGFGALSGIAGALPAPDTVTVKDPADFTLIGREDLPRKDNRVKTDGSGQFALDVFPEGALVAVMKRPPKFGGTVVSFDPETAKAASPTVTDVVETPRGVAVLAPDYYAAQKGRDALTVEWDFADAETRSSDQMFDDWRAALDGELVSARADGDVDTAMADAAQTFEAEYEFPYLSHSPLEPLNAVCALSADKCEIWAGSQLQTGDQTIAASIAGVRPDQVVIHTMLAGGSFGRRAVPDSDWVAEAVMIARAIEGRAPVKLIWSREDDMTGGRYRPMSVHRVKAGLDANKQPLAWSHDMAMQSYLRGSSFEGLIIDGVDSSAVEGARGVPYAIANLSVGVTYPQSPVPCLWWRSVGHTHNGYVTETLIDELAHMADADPVAFRLALLDASTGPTAPRWAGALRLAAEKADWTGPDLGERRGRGVAVHESFGSFVAQIADVSVAEDGSWTCDRVICAVDCGVAITPDVVKAQMQGGILMGLGAIRREQITLTDGVVDQTNFDRYQPLRLNEAPPVEVHVVASAERPTGVGEPGLPPIGPAVANALFAAAGVRVRKLPIGDRITV
ncbi:MAG: molybdopterin cofactor-binding domain-containing protein [Maricaulaceae bacterium]